MTAKESTVIDDLAICHYPYKWQEAQKIAARNLTVELASFEFWLLVRTAFLELGGEYRDQLTIEGQMHYNRSGCVLHDGP